MKTLNASLFSLVLGIASLGTVACSANVTEPSNNEADETPAAPASALTASMPKVTEQASELLSAGALEIYFDDLKTAWSVEDFELKMENVATVGSATGGAGGGKAAFEGATFRLRPLPGNASLSRMMSVGGHSPKVVLRQENEKGTFVELATLGTVFIDNITTDFSDGITDTVSVKFGQFDMKRGAVSVSWDVLKNKGSMSGQCVKNNTAQIGPFVQGPSFATVPTGWGYVESADISVSNVATAGSATGGAGAGKATLDHFTVTGNSDESSACMVWALLSGAHASEVRLDSGTTLDQGNLVVEQSWRACLAFPKAISLTIGTGDLAMKQTTEMAAGGLVSMAPNGSTVLYGWSFTKNKAITSCTQML